MNDIQKSGCPDDRRLMDYCLGKLDEDLIEQVFQHVETCSKCAELVEDLDRFPVPFLSKLRQMPLTPERELLLEPEFLDALRQIPAAIEASASSVLS